MFKLLRNTLVVLCLLQLFPTSALAVPREHDKSSPRERSAISRFLARIFGDGLIIPQP